MQASDHNGAYPLYTACEFSSAKVVKYLVALAEVDTLNNVYAKNNSPLHYVQRRYFVCDKVSASGKRTISLREKQ